MSSPPFMCFGSNKCSLGGHNRLTDPKLLNGSVQKKKKKINKKNKLTGKECILRMGIFLYKQKEHLIKSKLIQQLPETDICILCFVVHDHLLINCSCGILHGLLKPVRKKKMLLNSS